MSSYHTILTIPEKVEGQITDVSSQDQVYLDLGNPALPVIFASLTQLPNGAERNEGGDDLKNLATVLTESVNDISYEHAHYEEYHGLLGKEIETANGIEDQEGSSCCVDVGATMKRCHRAMWSGERAINVIVGWMPKCGDFDDRLRIILPYVVRSMVIMFNWYMSMKAVHLHTSGEWNPTEVISMVSLVEGIVLTWPLLPLYLTADVTGQADEEIKLTCLRLEVLHIVYGSIPQVGVYVYTAWASDRSMHSGDILPILVPSVFICVVLFKVYGFLKLEHNIVSQTIGKGLEFSVAVAISSLAVSTVFRCIYRHPAIKVTAYPSTWMLNPAIFYLICFLSLICLVPYFVLIIYWACPPRYGRDIWNLTHEKELLFREFFDNVLSFDLLTFCIILMGFSINLIVYSLLANIPVTFSFGINIALLVRMGVLVKSAKEFLIFAVAIPILATLSAHVILSVTVLLVMFIVGWLLVIVHFLLTFGLLICLFVALCCSSMFCLSQLSDQVPTNIEQNYDSKMMMRIFDDSDDDI